jgi:signal transduction histidine kinase
LTLQTRAVQLSLRQEPFEPDLVATGLDEIRELTRGALAEMRALIFQLRPAALHEEGLVSAVRKHAAAVSAKEGLEVTVTGPDEILTLDPQVEAELFRVIQEAMHNTVKHAHARAMSVAITPIGPAPADLVIEVTDDGDGFDVLEQHPGHLGLQSMAERMQHLGGSLRVDSRPGFSTTVRAVVPDPGHLRSTAGKLAGE